MIQTGMRLAVAVVALGVAAANAAQRMPLMMSVGCVVQEGEQRWIVSATEPVEITEEVSPEPDVSTPLGEGRLRLIGTLDEFGVSNHTGHKVRVKGIRIKGNDDTRLNLTSLRHLLPACE